MLLVCPILKTNIDKLEAKFIHNYHLGTNVFYISPIDKDGIMSFVTDKDQPEWRLDHFKKNKGAIKEYTKAPRDLQIYPTFYPTPRMHMWESFARFYASNLWEAANTPRGKCRGIFAFVQHNPHFSTGLSADQRCPMSEGQALV